MNHLDIKVESKNLAITILSICSYAIVKGRLEPTHLKSSPLFTFTTKSLGQDCLPIQPFSKTIGSRLTAAKIKLGEVSPSSFVFFLGQDSA